MYYFNALADWLCGCAHRRTTFPLTLPAIGTYIVCLDCGRPFAYDWSKMQRTSRRLAWVTTLLPVLGAAKRVLR